MAKIRDDLEGIALTEGGLILRAGDEIPKGVKVGDHLLAEDTLGDDSDSTGSDGNENTPEGSGSTGAPTPPPTGGAGSGADAWRAYAAAAAEKAGLQIEIPANANRADIIEALKGADIPVE